MYDEGILNEKTTIHLAEPTNYLVLSLVDSLEASEEEQDITVLLHLMKRIQKSLVILLKPHINIKNIDILKEVFTWLGSPNFIGKLVNDKKFRQEKKDMHTYITSIAAPLINERDPDGNCATMGCKKLALPENGEFKGSKYCALHHEAVFKVLASSFLVLFLVCFLHEMSISFYVLACLSSSTLPFFFSVFVSGQHLFVALLC